MERKNVAKLGEEVRRWLKMKKPILIMTGLILLTLFLSSGSALARHRGYFGGFIAPPPFWAGPPAVYYGGYYPPPGYYGPGYYSGYIMVRLASGSPATGQIDGLLMVGKGLGSRGIGNIADK